MSVRSFTVFQDIPSDRPAPHDPTDAQPITPPASDTAATLLSTLAAIEKENLHPVTGQRPGPTVASETKKRKTSALTTKVIVVPSSKKHKELKIEPKKTRKPLSSAKPRSADARKSSKPSRSSRKTSPLPSVSEEQELQRQPPRLSISQTDINSRCYELTVSPLADVSDAYDATRTENQGSDVHSKKDKPIEPAIRDYFSPPSVTKPLLTTNDTPRGNEDDSSQASSFSTPERKHIYSTFTFSSPSPISERFKQTSSPPRRDPPASNSE